MDSWVANLSDGSTKVEEWVNGALSPWQRLMEYCKKNHCYVTNLRLTVGTRTVSCKPNAAGYWQAHGMPTVQGVENDEELHKWRGIGHVEDGIIYITWVARDPVTHNVVAWQDARKAKNQAQVIWSTPSLAQIVDAEVMRGDAEVAKLEKFNERLVESTGGLAEVHSLHSH